MSLDSSLARALAMSRSGHIERRSCISSDFRPWICLMEAGVGRCITSFSRDSILSEMRSMAMK